MDTQAKGTTRQEIKVGLGCMRAYRKKKYLNIVNTPMPSAAFSSPVPFSLEEDEARTRESQNMEGQNTGESEDGRVRTGSEHREGLQTCYLTTGLWAVPLQSP